MAIPLVKLSVLVGAGLVGSVLSQEGRTRDFLSGAFKIFVKQIKRADSTSSPSGSKPQNEALLAQVNNLRQELQLLACDNNSQTIIMTGGRSGGISTYGPPLVIIIAVGYGIIWWKGWKLSSLMFVTKRDLNIHRASVAEGADQVYTDIEVTRKDVSAKMINTDSGIDSNMAETRELKEEVGRVIGEITDFSKDIHVVREAVTSLKSRVGRFQEKQELTYGGVYFLCEKELEDDPSKKALPSTSKPALEPSQTTYAPRLLHSTSMPVGVGLLSFETPSTPSQASPSMSPRIVEIPKATYTQASPSPSPRIVEIPKATYTPTRSLSLAPEPPTPSSSNASASTTSSRFNGWLPRNWT